MSTTDMSARPAASFGESVLADGTRIRMLRAAQIPACTAFGWKSSASVPRCAPPAPPSPQPARHASRRDQGKESAHGGEQYG